MGNYTHTNFFTSTLAGGASGVGTNLQLADTSLFVATGDGSKAGSPTASAPGYLMLGSYSGTHELCSYTGVSGDHLTGLTRGLESTTAQVWATTTSVQGVETAGMQGHILYDDGGTISTNGTGGMTVTAPATLRSGSQETGFVGIQMAAAGAGGGFAVGVGINFKTVMTNAPSSLTLSASVSGNVSGSPTANTFTKYGCLFNISPVASGQVFWYGTYVTVGNCIRVVDAAAGTFDHHCDQCGTLTRGRSITGDLDVNQSLGLDTPGAYGLSVTCPHCGAVECLNTGLTAEDEQDVTPAPDGGTTRGEQARFIRQLQIAKGLAVL